MAAGVLLVAAVWAIVAPYTDGLVGLQVNVRVAVEVADHVIPGIVAGVGAIVLVIRPRLALETGLLVSLAGAWMIATHVPLVVDAAKGAGSMGAAVWHVAPGVALLISALAVVAFSFRR